MVDVSGKPATQRRALAEGLVTMNAAAFAAVQDSSRGSGKGNVLSTAELAGVMAAKRTAELIPLCHPLPLTQVNVRLDPEPGRCRVRVRADVSAYAPTGVEMEALTAVSAAALTVYDMCKALDRAIRIEGIRLLEKTGGRSGDYRADNDAGPAGEIA